MISTIILTPYFEDPAFKQFCASLDSEIDASMRIIIVDDGSVCSPLVAEDFKGTSFRGVILTMQRNLGHQIAISAGLDYAVQNYEFDKLVILDSDGEDRPADIHILTKVLEDQKGEVDIVAATRKSRQETMRFKIFYSVYQSFFRLLVGSPIAFGNFMTMTQEAALRLASSKETVLHIAASALNSRLRIKLQPLDRGARFAGESKMNLVNLVLHGLRSIMVFSEEVIVRITLLCFAVAMMVFLVLIIMVIMKLAGATIPGWYSTGSGLLMLLLFQTGSMALIVLLSADRIRGRVSRNLDYREIVKEVITLDQNEDEDDLIKSRIGRY
jgi:glycosyltransferase involved in cell wall biosynthesis